MGTDSLLAEIDAFLAQAGVSESTFGRLAVNDGKFVGRLRAGKRCWPETADKARQYILNTDPATLRGRTLKEAV